MLCIGSETLAENRVYLVDLVYLVYMLYLVDLVSHSQSERRRAQRQRAGKPTAFMSYCVVEFIELIRFKNLLYCKDSYFLA